MTRPRLILLLLSFTVAATAVFLLLRCKCPDSGIGFTRERRTLQRLKNRTVIPQASDFDPNATAEALLSIGNDANRWSSSRAARIEVFVISIAPARPEAANCFVARDTHIHAALRPDAPPSEHIVVEITPRMERFAAQQRLDWSAETLRKTLVGRWVTFEGWLLFDSEHADESENIAPGSTENWRRTAWEIHPVTHFRISR